MTMPKPISALALLATSLCLLASLLAHFFP